MVRERSQKHQQPLHPEVKQLLRSDGPACRKNERLRILPGGRDTGARAAAAEADVRACSVKDMEVQERERQRIAMDLHDGLGQALTLIKLELANATSLLGNLDVNPDAHASLLRARSKLQDALGELRRTVMDLRPSMIDDLGILPTLSWFFREMETTAPHIAIEKYIAVREVDVDAPLRITIFRIVQEAVNNIIKHAHADRIQVILCKAGSILYLQIQDNGCGFDLSAAGNLHCSRGGIGGMMRRARASAGECFIASSTGGGTRISVSWKC